MAPKLRPSFGGLRGLRPCIAMPSAWPRRSPTGYGVGLAPSFKSVRSF